jgi:hypothetical protein
MSKFTMSANVHLEGPVATYEENEDRTHSWISLTAAVYPSIALHCDREALESLIAAATTALMERDIKEGRLQAGDEGVVDLGSNPFECAHQQ